MHNLYFWANFVDVTFFPVLMGLDQCLPTVLDSDNTGAADGLSTVDLVLSSSLYVPYLAFSLCRKAYRGRQRWFGRRRARILKYLAGS